MPTCSEGKAPLRSCVYHAMLGGSQRSQSETKFAIRHSARHQKQTHAEINHSTEKFVTGLCPETQGLWGVRFVSTQLKDLDRHRDRQLRRLRCRLKYLPAPDRQAQDANGSNNTAPFYGAPFSYHSQFVRSTELLEERKGNGLWLRITNLIQRLKATLRSRF